MFNNFNVNMTYFYSLKEIFYCRRHFSLNIDRGKGLDQNTFQCLILFGFDAVDTSSALCVVILCMQASK